MLISAWVGDINSRGLKQIALKFDISVMNRLKHKLLL